MFGLRKRITAKDLKPGHIYHAVKETMKPLDPPFNHVNRQTLDRDIAVIRNDKQNTGRTICYLYLRGEYTYEEYIHVTDDREFKEVKDDVKKQILINYTLYNKIRHCVSRHTMGADPEIFATDENGNLIPAFHYVGSKEKPTRTVQRSAKQVTRGTPSETEGLPVYWDGYAAEFQTSPQSCLGWFADSVQIGLRTVYNSLIKDHPNAKLSSFSMFLLTGKELNDAAEEHVALGCTPSLNAYGIENAIPYNARMLQIRSAGGHIHFGCGKLTKDKAKQHVQALDTILGVACVALFAKHDNPERRKYYGLAGEYRLPPHGLEYRTLSNAWLIHPVLYNLVFDMARVCFSLGGNDVLKKWDCTEKETIDIISNCDVLKAREVLTRNKNFFLAVLKACYPGLKDNGRELLFTAFHDGLEVLVENSQDIVGNWDLNKPDEWQGHCDHKSVSKTIQKFFSKKKAA